MLIAVIVSCLTMFFIAFRVLPTLAQNYQDICKKGVLATLLACCFMYGSYRYANAPAGFISYDLNNALISVLALPSCIFIACLLVILLEKFVRHLYSHLDIFDIKIYFGFFVVAEVVVTLLYATNDLWYMQYDDVYSMDSGFCFQTIFQGVTYYDVRHPLFGSLARLLWCTAYGFVHFLAPSNLELIICAIALQTLNIFAILAIGAMIRIMSNNKFISLIFICSASTILFSVFFEKYALCTFFLVLAVYLTLFRTKYISLSYVAAVGTMPTSAFAVAVLIALLGIRVSWKTAGRIVAASVCVGISALVCTGNLWLFDFSYTSNSMGLIATTFMKESIGYSGRILSCLNLIQGIFLPLSSVLGEAYNWIPLHTIFNKLAVVILVIVLCGLIRGVFDKDRFAIVCGFWVLFIPVLFVGLNWVPAESALFSLYFSWAVVPLFASGASWICSLLQLNEQRVFAVISMICLILSLANLANIALFLYLS